MTAALSLPTPEPGTIPASVSCTVRHRRSSEAEARASTAMSRAGSAARQAERSSSADSMPVAPSTPGFTALTVVKAAKSSGMPRLRWRVAMTELTASGPTASGVISSLPSPATSVPLPLSAGRRPRMSSASSPAASSNASDVRHIRGSRPSVIYLPMGLHNERAPSSSSISTVVTSKPPRC